MELHGRAGDLEECPVVAHRERKVQMRSLNVMDWQGQETTFGLQDREGQKSRKRCNDLRFASLLPLLPQYRVSGCKTFIMFYAR